MVTSDSDWSPTGPDAELEELFREIDMARTQEYSDPDKGIDEYLKRKDGNERAKERMKSGEQTSTSRARAVPVGRWKLDMYVWVDEPGRSMTEAEIKKLRIDCIIPNSIILWPVEAGEYAAKPPP